MKGVTSWGYRPYHPIVNDGTDIYICRLAPSADSVTVEWLYEYDQKDVPAVFGWRKRGEGEYTTVLVRGHEYTLAGLENDTEYELRVTSGEHKSKVRLARTGEVTGTVVNYLHPDDDVYDFSGHTLGSPSLVRLPSGALLASMDLYSNGFPQNLDLIFRSDDNGETWHYVSEVMPCFWGKLFWHRGRLYMMGTRTEYGDLLIGVSDDEGKTWSMPTTLFQGSGNRFFRGFLSCPTPVVEVNGRIWKAVDWGDRRAYEKETPFPHAQALVSAPADSDLMDVNSWELTPPLDYCQDWQGTAKGKDGCICQGCMESNAVAAPNGELWVIPRYHTYNCEPGYGRIVLFKADPDRPEKQLSFYKVIDLNGNTSKFEIIYDAVTGYYINVLNGLDERNRNNVSSRNLVMMYKSKDLENWEFAGNLLDVVGKPSAGIQNPSLVIDGDDLIMTCRTAANSPLSMNAMYANYNTFHRIRNFRDMLKG